MRYLSCAIGDVWTLAGYRPLIDLSLANDPEDFTGPTERSRQKPAKQLGCFYHRRPGGPAKSQFSSRWKLKGADWAASGPAAWPGPAKAILDAPLHRRGISPSRPAMSLSRGSLSTRAPLPMARPATTAVKGGGALAVGGGRGSAVGSPPARLSSAPFCAELTGFFRERQEKNGADMRAPLPSSVPSAPPQSLSTGPGTAGRRKTVFRKSIRP